MIDIERHCFVYRPSMETTTQIKNPDAVRITEILRDELARRCKKNPAYSMRSFSKTLGIHPSVMSLVLTGKRRVSKKTALKISNVLILKPAELQLLFRSAGFNTGVGSDSSEHERLRLDQFEFISSWEHYAILSLLELPRSKYQSKWIAMRLGISEVVAVSAMHRIERLGLVAQDSKGKWTQSSRPIAIENSVSTPATRSHHRQLLQKAGEVLDNSAIEERDFSATTFAMNKKDINFALLRIREFRRALVLELEQRSIPDSVYELSVQLFPLTKNEVVK